MERDRIFLESRHLGIKVNLLGMMLYYREEVGYFSLSELADFAIHSGFVSGRDKKAVMVTIRNRAICDLVRRGLLVSFTRDEAIEKGIEWDRWFSKNVQRVYVITPHGEELLSYINPYSSLIKGAFRPVSMTMASRVISYYLGREKKSFTYERLKQMCYVRKKHGTYVVLKKEKDIEKYFPDNALSSASVLSYLETHGFSHKFCISVLKNLFREKDTVNFFEFENYFLF